MTQEETIKKIIEMADSIGEECIHIHEGGENYDKYVSYNKHPGIEHLAEEFKNILRNFIMTEDGGTSIRNMMEFNKYPKNKYLIRPFGWLTGVVLVRKEDNVLIYYFKEIITMTYKIEEVNGTQYLVVLNEKGEEIKNHWLHPNDPCATCPYFLGQCSIDCKRLPNKYEITHKD